MLIEGSNEDFLKIFLIFWYFSELFSTIDIT